MPQQVPASRAEIDAFLAERPHWSVEAAMLVRTFEAPSFLEAVEFVRHVAAEAERADHHPDIDIRWRRVTLRWVTHDAGHAISALDLKLAKISDGLFASRFQSR